MVKLWMLNGSGKVSCENGDESIESVTRDQAVLTEPLIMADAGVQAELKPDQNSIGVQTPPRTLELGCQKGATAIAHSVCKRVEQWDCVAREQCGSNMLSCLSSSQILIFLARTRLIRNRMCCKSCPHYPFMLLEPRPDCVDGWQWICPNCSLTVSVRHKSRLFAYPLPLRELITRIRYWCQNNPGKRKRSLSSLYTTQLRRICALDNEHFESAKRFLRERAASEVRRERIRGGTYQREAIGPEAKPKRLMYRLEELKWRKRHQRGTFSSFLYACAIYQTYKKYIHVYSDVLFEQVTGQE
ncbi:hypothetical protein EG68_08862 [Paragonimus skrjabini miyazakii]|uniref:Uncharacterized protein n=1 Tax=Paragonimus skrjabini miyazakii TaxID=59628 RepID=A0A8S9YLW6_9TREM|nr:hypothetical protein EG68_08862 [Paragonimus skrjabini miyazakii]